jgi:hypothetical protein
MSNGTNFKTDKNLNKFQEYSQKKKVRRIEKNIRPSLKAIFDEVSKKSTEINKGGR